MRTKSSVFDNNTNALVCIYLCIYIYLFIYVVITYYVIFSFIIYIYIDSIYALYLYIHKSLSISMHVCKSNTHVSFPRWGLRLVFPVTSGAEDGGEGLDSDCRWRRRSGNRSRFRHLGLSVRPTAKEAKADSTEKEAGCCCGNFDFGLMASSWFRSTAGSVSEMNEHDEHYGGGGILAFPLSSFTREPSCMTTATPLGFLALTTGY